ncbi:MAG TPA: hypothetical protein VG225_11920 [Terracidiphilus sp.]|nr:hypothetical protein [Terracidiphilus sp.]
MTRRFFSSGVFPVLLFSLLGFLTMGYHPGAEDDGVYLASIKADLNPALFPHDAAWFQLQMRSSIFDTCMAHFVRASHLSVDWAELLGQIFSLLLIMAASWSILSRLFSRASARWGGLALLSGLLTLPVAGTALYIADQYLHPRNPATALILFAVARILARRRVQAVPLLLGAFLLHPMMGAFGISFCCILALTHSSRARSAAQSLRASLSRRPAQVAAPMAALVPLGWMFQPPSSAWLDAMSTRHWFHLYQWTWYEWLGALGPLVLFGLLIRLARRNGNSTLARFAAAVLIYGVFQQLVAMILNGPRALVVLSTLEPMRYLHLVYVFLVLIGGALLGQHLLQARAARWAAFLVLIYGPMFAVQRQLFAATPHLELPGRATSNPWLQSFDWVRRNTPTGAFFALGPRYMAEPGEDMHSFRALAERSVLADALKDTSVISKAPDLAPLWRRQIDAQAGWNGFQLPDFERLKAQFGVDWVLLAYPPPAGLPCPWRNQGLSVCRIP